jgi:hypothetical protein
MGCWCYYGRKMAGDELKKVSYQWEVEERWQGRTNRSWREMTGKEFFFCQCFFFKREKLFVFLFQFIQSSIFFLASLSVLLVYWLALRSGLILLFLNVKKIFKSIENVLIPLSLVVVLDPSALGLAAIPGRPKRLGSNSHA